MTPRTLVTAAFVMTVLVPGLSARASIHTESPSRDPLRGRGHSNRIVVENAHQGTTGWVTPEFRQSRSPRDRRSSPRLRAAAVWNDSTIRGYAGATSYNRDEPIDLHISTSAPSYDIEVHRMGWYGGMGARLFLTVTGLPGLDQPAPAPDPRRAETRRQPPFPRRAPPRISMGGVIGTTGFWPPTADPPYQRVTESDLRASLLARGPKFHAELATRQEGRTI